MQFNAPDPASLVIRGETLDVNGDGKNEALLFDASSGNISVLARQKDGSFSLDKLFAAGQFTLKDVFRADFNGDGKGDLLLAADDRMGIILTGIEDPAFVTLASHKTAVEEGDLYDACAGDVGGDPRPELLVLENRKHCLEILSFDGKAISQELTFPVFEEREDLFRGFFFKRSNQNEPRETVLTDLDGDGRKDIIMLAHENILFYRQEP
jgi:hypothetical protein